MGDKTRDLGDGLIEVWHDNGDGTWSRSSDSGIRTVEAVALASLARTATNNTADFTNDHHHGVMVFLNITAASGTGGLQVRIQAKDPASGVYVNLNSLPTAVIVTGLNTYVVYPAQVGGTQGTDQALPRTWRILVTHGDGTSYTYSVGYCLLP